MDEAHAGWAVSQHTETRQERPSHRLHGHLQAGGLGGCPPGGRQAFCSHRRLGPRQTPRASGPHLLACGPSQPCFRLFTF